MSLRPDDDGEGEPDTRRNDDVTDLRAIVPDVTST